MEFETKDETDAKQQITTQSEKDLEKIERKKRLKQKIIALGRMNAMLGNLRENSEVILQMKQVSLDGKLPRGLLLEKRSSIKFDLETFMLTKDLDAKNEKRPKAKPKD